MNHVDESLTPLGFLGRVLVLMVPSFLIWAIFSQSIGAMGVVLGDWVLPMLWPDAIDSMRLNGTEAILISVWGEAGGKLLPLSQSDDALAVIADTRVVSYSLPFFWSLHFALGSGRAAFLWIGTVLLFLLMSVGIAAIQLKNLVVTVMSADPVLAAWVLPSLDVVAMAYQFSILIVPTVAPVMIWIAQNREHPLLKGFVTKTNG